MENFCLYKFYKSLIWCIYIFEKTFNTFYNESIILKIR